MENLLVVLHILFCVIVVGLVLIKDPKGGGGGILGGGGSNSVLGATGATTLAQKLTRIFGILFVLTAVGVTWMLSKGNKSVVDSLPVPVSAAPATPAVETKAAPAADVPAATAPAATEAPKEEKKNP